MGGRVGHKRQLWELNWKDGIGLDVAGYERSKLMPLDEIELLLCWNRAQHAADGEAFESRLRGRK